MRTWIPVKLVLSLVGAAVCSFATTDTLQFLNANNSYIMGGVYTSPYNIAVSGVSTPLICDDFTTDVLTTGPWNATVTTLSSLNGESSASTAVKFDQTNAGQQVLDYSTAAVLAAELMSLPSSNTVAGAEISFAIWGVFDPGLLQAPVAPSTNYTSNDPYGPGLTSAQVQAAYVLLQQAVGWVNSAQTGTTTVSLSKLDEASGLSIAGLNIYTPSPNQSVSQEFLQVSMPEPSYPAVLALDLLAVAGLMFFFRRRTSGKIN